MTEKMNEITKVKETPTNGMQIIDINGVKMEVDMRTAKIAKLEVYKVGTKIRVLKKTYSDTFETFGGVIIGFDQFKERPSILIAYLKTDYSSCEIEFVSYNKDTKDIEICPADDGFVPFKKATIMEQMRKQVLQAETTLMEIKAKSEYFHRYFGKYFDKE